MFQINQNLLKYRSATQFFLSQNYRLFCTENAEQAIKKKSGCQVKLIGRVKNELLSMPNDVQSFHVRTATKSLGDLIYVTHRILAPNNLVDSLSPQLRNMDLVYLTGEIQYQRYPNGESFVSIPRILAKNLMRMDNENESEDLDKLEKESMNEVKLIGVIGGDISDEKATIFSIVTNTDITKTDTYYGDWHRVLILDENLRNFVRNNIRTSDKIIVNGEIIYNKVTLENGNTAPQSVILANRIQKLFRFTMNELVKPENQTTVEQ